MVSEEIVVLQWWESQMQNICDPPMAKLLCSLYNPHITHSSCRLPEEGLCQLCTVFRVVIILIIINLFETKFSSSTDRLID